MQREIKFRVWDDIASKMWYPEEGLKACVTQVGRVCTDETDDGGILESRSYCMTALFYIGLKDSYAIEEYLGDIIEEEDGTRRVIEDGCSAIYFKNPDTKYDIKYFWELGVHKVIGNIYENKDML